MSNNIEDFTTWTAVDGTFSCGSGVLTDVSVWHGEHIDNFVVHEPIALSVDDTITFTLTCSPKDGTWKYVSHSTQDITKKKKWNHEG